MPVAPMAVPMLDGDEHGPNLLSATTARIGRQKKVSAKKVVKSVEEATVSYRGVAAAEAAAAAAGEIDQASIGSAVASIIFTKGLGSVAVENSTRIGAAQVPIIWHSQDFREVLANLSQVLYAPA